MRRCEICGSSFMSPRNNLCSNTNCPNSVYKEPAMFQLDEELANPIEEIGYLVHESEESDDEEMCEIRSEQQRNIKLKEEGEALNAVKTQFPSFSDAHPGIFQRSEPIEIPKPVAAQEAIPSSSKVPKSGFCVICEERFPCIASHSETELHKNKTEIITSDNKNSLVPANSLESEFTKCRNCKFLIYTTRLNSHNNCYPDDPHKEFGKGN